MKEELIKLRKALEETKRDDEKTYRKLEKDLKLSLHNIRNLTEKNSPELLLDMFDNYRQIEALEENITETSKIIVDLSNEKMNLTEKLNGKADDVFREYPRRILGLYYLLSIGVYASSSDIREFFRKYLILLFIALSSYKIDSLYFDSEKRRKKLIDKIEEIDIYLETNRYAYRILKKFLLVYEELLACESEKLKEVLPKMMPGEDIQEYFTRIMPFASNVEFVLIDDDAKGKKLTK